MSNDKGLVPTVPGWWWAHVCNQTEPEIIKIDPAGGVTMNNEDGKWHIDDRDAFGNGPMFVIIGPVPMPGEWAPRELFDRLLDAALDTGFPHQAVTDAMEWKEAIP